MKAKIISLFMMCALSCAANAQQDVEKGFFAEVDAGYSNLYNEKFAVISPSVGYQFNKRFLAGMRVGFETRRYGYTVYTPFVRYNYLPMARCKLFAEAQANIAQREVEGGQASYSEIGLALGASLSLSRHIKMVGRYLFIGYSERDARKAPYMGNGDFLLDANVTRLQLGLQVIF